MRLYFLVALCGVITGLAATSFATDCSAIINSEPLELIESSGDAPLIGILNRVETLQMLQNAQSDEIQFCFNLSGLEPTASEGLCGVVLEEELK